MSPKSNSNSHGFTLLEILLVVGIIAILAGIVILAINPSRQLAQVRNTERRSDIKQIYNAMQQYYIDHGHYPTSTPATLTEICDTGTTSTCLDAELIDLSALVPVYITAIPKDPSGSTLSFINKAFASTYGTGYKVMQDNTNKIVLWAPEAELDTFIGIGTSTATSTEGCDATCLALRVGLAAYYPMDSDLNDYSGNGNNVTSNSGAVSTGDSVVNGAYNFQGNLVVVPQSESLNLKNDVTVVAWVKLDQLGTGWRGVFGTKTRLEGSWEFVVNGGDNLEVHWIGQNEIISNNAVSDTGWHQIAWVKNGYTFTYYIDTVTTGTTYNGGENATFIDRTDDNLIGGHENNSASMYGKIDELGLWNRALSAGEISQLYNGGSGRSLMTD